MSDARPMPGLPPPRPIPLRDRASILFVEKGRLDVLDGAFVLVDEGGIRTHIPIGGLACLMLEPGTRVSHMAVVLAARAGTLLIWVGEAGVRLASAVDRAWLDLEPLAAANLTAGEELLYHPSRRQVEARLQTRWMDLVLDETPTAIRDEAGAALLLAKEAAAQFDRVSPSLDSAAGAFLARLRWLAGAAADLGLPTLDDAALKGFLPDLCQGLRSLDEVQAADWLSPLHAAVGYDRLPEIERLAPTHLDLPNGKRFALQYESSGPPILAVRIQELFGVPETPRLAGGRIPVLLHLLGPNHRPQQVTSDLASFWKNTYPTVKKELRRRYPKHAWPDDPLTVPPAKKPTR